MPSIRGKDLCADIAGAIATCAIGMLLSVTPWNSAKAQVDADFIDDETGVRIRRTQTAPVLDGKLDDAVWSTASVVRDFHQMEPVEYAEPSEPTEMYLLYDDDKLYIGAKMFDANPGQILAKVLRQGQSIITDDRIYVHIDTFGNRRGGYVFGVNPNGVRFDGIYEYTRRSFNWEGIWESAASITDDGWVAEIAVPFKTLSFDPANTTWRMNFTRLIERKNEAMAWSSRNSDTDLSTMRDVRGIEGINQGVGLDVMPSLSIRNRTDFVLADSDTQTEPSLDIFYKLTPSLNASLTINTDFSATEVDDRQVNLTRFNLFFPEKRDFFLQDSDIFKFGRIDQDGRPFFSRRLGIGPGGQEVPIDYGGKLSGRVGRFEIGALAMRQEAFGEVDATSALVGRIAASVLEESSIGVIVTDGDPASNLDNSLVGVDFRYYNSRIRGGRGVEGDVWIQASNSEGLEGDNRALGIGLEFLGSTGFRGGFDLYRFEENFDPALGFVRRTGVEQYQSTFDHMWRPRTGPLRTIRTGIMFDQISYLDNGDLQSRTMDFDLVELALNSQEIFKLTVTRNQEGLRNPFEISPGVILEPGRYDFDSYAFSLTTGNHRPVDTQLQITGGEFWDGDRSAISGFVGWRPNAHFRSELRFEYNDIELPEGAFITRLVRLNLQAIFSSSLSWINLIQYDNVSETIGLNSRLHWIPQAGREAYLVLNQNVQDLDRDGNFHSISKDLSLKFSYTFRF